MISTSSTAAATWSLDEPSRLVLEAAAALYRLLDSVSRRFCVSAALINVAQLATDSSFCCIIHWRHAVIIPFVQRHSRLNQAMAPLGVLLFCRAVQRRSVDENTHEQVLGHRRRVAAASARCAHIV